VVTQESRQGFLPCLICNTNLDTNVNSLCHSMETSDVLIKILYEKKEEKLKCKKHPFTTKHTTADCKMDQSKNVSTFPRRITFFNLLNKKTCIIVAMESIKSSSSGPRSDDSKSCRGVDRQEKGKWALFGMSPC